MKLNLLPPYVSKGKQSKVAIVLMLLILLASIAASLGMMFVSKQAYEREKARADALEKPANDVVALSKLADTITASAQTVVLNVELAKAMQEHCSAYPDFYDSVRRYIPAFFRVTSMSASPMDAETVTLTLSGVIKSQEEYANLMLALNRIPDVRSVSRSGFQLVETYVPNLTQTDQTGRPIRQGEQPLPDDPLDRLQALIARGSTASGGYLGVGNFGSGEPGLRGAMPDWSQITVTVVMPGKLQAPDVRATLANAARASSSTGTTGSMPTGMGGFGPPGGMGSFGPPGGLGMGGPAGLREED
ncbi:MAG: hypothetical protein N2109_11055 [Fimbriimonadales bacterium]|nr:hypothetical protein [Fimbriimonadales bacterium]